MSKYTDIIHNMIKSQVDAIEGSIPGTVIKFDHLAHMATVEVAKRVGTGVDNLKLPWMQPKPGVYSPDPDLGTKVVVSFFGSNRMFPTITGTYDADYENNTLESHRNVNRKPATPARFLAG